MQVDNTVGGSFFRRAFEEAGRYGDDPWIFLRELVQNSRDAGAERIEFTAKHTLSNEEIVCCDDGSGMTRSEIEQFLLRLYASNKEDQQTAIGFFGVGFWSVLLFSPILIRVISRKGQDNCAFEIDCRSHLIAEVPLAIKKSGTEITLVREIEQDSSAEHDLATTVRNKLIHYASHVRPLPGKRQPQLLCNGEMLNRPFSTPRYVGRRFKTARFDGVVGFGTTPKISIYKGGILVRDLSSLEEVIPSRPSKLAPAGWGLHPWAAINADGLQLLMDRNTVYEDPILHEAVDYCERELIELNRKVTGRMLPMNLRNLILYNVSRFKKRGVLWGVGLIISILLVLLFLAEPFRSIQRKLSADDVGIGAVPIADSRTASVMNLSFEEWDGSLIGAKQQEQVKWNFLYEGPEGLLFRLRTLDRYDPGRGLVPETHRIVESYPAYTQAGREAVAVVLGVFKPTHNMVLPVPPGHVLIKASVRDSQGRLIAFGQNQFGEPVAETVDPGQLRYMVVESKEILPLNFSLSDSLKWPPNVLKLLDEVTNQPIADRPVVLMDWIEEHFIYSQKPVLSYMPVADHETWMERVLQLGAGDCDILNGILVLLLRSAGIDAQLTIGLIGDRGTVRPDLHAWARYYLDGWQIVDVTERFSSGLADGDSTNLQGTAESIGEHDPTPYSSTDQELDDLSLDKTEETVGPFWSVHRWGAIAFLIPLCIPLFYLLRNLSWLNGRFQIKNPQEFLELFDHYFSRGNVDDPLKLRFRPLILLLDKRKVSLTEIQKAASRSQLMGAYPGAKLLSYIEDGRFILDRSSELVRLLLPFLPPITWLEDLDPILDDSPLHPQIRKVEQTIQKLDQHFRIHQVPGSARLEEISLALKRPLSGKRHILFGEKHPLFDLIIKCSSDDSVYGVFVGAIRLLERTTLYLTQKEQFLTESAQTSHRLSKSSTQRFGRWMRSSG